MTDTNQQAANNFWFDFDNRFRYEPTIEVAESYSKMGGLTFPIDEFRKTRAAGTWPKSFIAEFQGAKGTAVGFLTAQQEIMFNEHFTGDSAFESMTNTFVEFGTGLLTDERRDTSKYFDNVIHSMDGSISNPPVGYHRWHGVIRVYTLLNGITDGLWLNVDRCVALAWAIQSELKPLGISSDGKNPNTKSIAPTKLDELKSLYLNMTFEQLDEAFDSAPYPAS